MTPAGRRPSATGHPTRAPRAGRTKRRKRRARAPPRPGRESSATFGSPWARPTPRLHTPGSSDVEVDADHLEAETAGDALRGDVVPGGAVERRRAQGPDRSGPVGHRANGVTAAAML